MHGIEHSKRVLEDLGTIVINGVDLARRGISIGSAKQIWDLANSLKDIVSEAQLALPELADLSPDEASELAGHSYLLLRNILRVVH